MVSHIPSFWFARFDEIIENDLGSEIICDGWWDFGGLPMQENSFENMLKWY